MAKKSKQTKRVFSDRWKYLLVVLVLFMYGKSVRFGFVLDDDLFIKNHPLVQQGVSAIPTSFSQGSMLHFQGSNFQIYRPFTISFFCFQKSLFGFNPAAFHFMSVISYALLCLLVYSLIRIFSSSIHPFIALLAAGLFTVHPVHSEVIANIKGQDELLAAIGCVASLFFALRYWDTKANRFFYFSILAFVVALFSKESAVAFLVAFPVSFFLLRNGSIKEAVIRSIPFLISVAVFMLARFLAIKGVKQDFETTIVENVLYGAKDNAQLWATKAGILFYYLKLMVWPFSLSWDYSFNQIPLFDWTAIEPLVAISVFSLLTLSAVLLIKRQPLFAWGISIFLFLILPTSNLFFLNGTTFAERFLFMPSLGVMVALIPFLDRIFGAQTSADTKLKYKKGVIPVLALISVACYGTAVRVSDWRDNLTLFESAARNAPNSSRVQAGLATEYMNKAERSILAQDRSKFIALSKEHFDKALSIYPQNSNASYKLGLINSIIGDTSSAIRCYRQAIDSKPDLVFALVNLSTIYASRAQWDSAAYHLEKAFEKDSLNEMVLTNLVVVNFNRASYDQVEKYGQLAIRNGKNSAKCDELMVVARTRAGNR
ncbi:MAG: glycosyltransferase family 39 protein [Bacteroidota bacterium]